MKVSDSTLDVILSVTRDLEKEYQDKEWVKNSKTASADDIAEFLKTLAKKLSADVGTLGQIIDILKEPYAMDYLGEIKIVDDTFAIMDNYGVKKYPFYSEMSQYDGSGSHRPIVDGPVAKPYTRIVKGDFSVMNTYALYIKKGADTQEVLKALLGDKLGVVSRDLPGTRQKLEALLSKDGGMLSSYQKRELLKKAHDQIYHNSSASLSVYQKQIAMKKVEEAVSHNGNVRDALAETSVLSVRQKGIVTKIVNDIKDGGLGAEDAQKVVLPAEAVGTAPAKTGGIDFRALPVESQRAVNPAVIAQGLAGMPLVSAEEMDKNWAAIQKTMAQGQMPYVELKKFVTNCYAQKNDGKYRKVATECVLNLLKLEEERAISTPDELKQIVVLL